MPYINWKSIWVRIKDLWLGEVINLAYKAKVKIYKDIFPYKRKKI